MKIHDLEVFCAVAEEESFVNAAHRMFVSQSAVTQHIKKIETELGFPLLIRNKHFVKITAQGEIFQRAAKDILLRYRQALDDCARESGAEQVLRLSYVGPSGAKYLTAILKKFHMQYPECDIATRRLRPDQVSSALEQNETNLVFTPYDLIADSSQLFFYPLFEDALYCVMDRSNPCAGRDQLQCRELAASRILLPSKTFRPPHMETVMNVLEKEGLQCSLEDGYNYDNTLMQLLSHENTVAVMPGSVVPDNPRLCAVPLLIGTHVRVGLAYRHPMTRTEEAFALLGRELTFS